MSSPRWFAAKSGNDHDSRGTSSQVGLPHPEGPDKRAAGGDPGIPKTNGPDSSSTESNRPDSNRPDSNRPDSNRPDSNRPDSNRPDSNRAELIGAGLIGREEELRLIAGLLDGVQTRGRALLLRGEAGIGKSTLLSEASREARQRGFQVLRTGGVQWEAHLPFACLHQLLRPVLGRIDELPSPQRTAMQAAFGMTDAAAPDFFFIALAVLDLLADAAAQTPLLLIVEDAQWLDQPTRDVLMFIARRLDSEPIIVLAAARTGSANGYAESGFPELLIEALPPAAAEAVLDTRAPDLAPELRERVLADAAGNPLALVELPAALPPGTVDRSAVLPEVLPLTRRLERAFAARVGDLPEATRVVLVAAATDDGDVLLSEVLAVATAVVGIRVTADVLEPAVTVRLVESDGLRIRFRHPLVRSAIHQAAGLGYRRILHAAWARVLLGQPDRQVWHQAASLIQPDESVAAGLEASAVRARRRGAIMKAIATLEQAARMTPDPAGQGNRLISAAELAFEIGSERTMNRLLEQSRRLELGPRERSRVACLQGVFDDGVPGDAERIWALLELAEWARNSDDLELTLQLLTGAARRCWWGDPGPQTRAAVVAAGERLDVDPLDPRLLAILAIPDPIGHGASVISRLAAGTAVHGNLPDEDPEGRGCDLPVDAATLLQRALCAYVVGDFGTVEHSLAGAIGALREQGRLALLAQALVTQSLAGTYRGNWAVARQAAEEASRLAEETNQPVWAATAQMVEAMVAGLRGDRDVSTELAAISEWAMTPMPYDSILGAVRAASGVVALADGRADDAYEHLRRVLDPADPAYHHMQRCWMIGFAAEAAVHSGRRDQCRSLLHALEPTASGTPSPMLQLGMGYARAVLADDDQAEELFRAALADPQLPHWPFPRARLHLAHGAWLRRQRRVAESRQPLRTARDLFDSLGARNYSERARQELRAAGEASQRRRPGVADLLSPQELQIAQMAAEGLSNREIGQRLYLSHRTVGSHLYRIFPKLEVTSRSQLKQALGGSLGGSIPAAGGSGP